MRKILLEASAALLLIGAVACSSSPAPVTAHGTVEVAASILNGTNTSDYPDITDGAQVTVVNSAGTVIGTGTLHFQRTLNIALVDSDWYTFTVSGLPGGLARYGFQVGNQSRGTVWETPAEVKSGPSLCVGDGC